MPTAILRTLDGCTREMEILEPMRILQTYMYRPFKFQFPDFGADTDLSAEKITTFTRTYELYRNPEPGIYEYRERWEE